RLRVKGWAWLPERNRRADCVVIGWEDPTGVFKPLTVLETGVARPDLRAQRRNPNFYRAGFAHAVPSAKIMPGTVVIKGWAIDLRAQKAWPLALPVSQTLSPVEARESTLLEKHPPASPRG